MTFPTPALVAAVLLASLGARLPAQTPAAQKTACVPPLEWGVTKTFAKWSVSRVCDFGAVGADVLSVTAASEAGSDRGFAFTCQTEGVGGLVVLNKIDLTGPLSLAFKGGPGPALALNGFGGSIATAVDLETSPATKRFEAALVDSPGLTFTLVVTQPGKPPQEMTFSRTGLPAAVKPLRSRCAW